MAEFFPTISDEHKSFIESQPIFFVATSNGGNGRINLSPKGMDSFRVLGPNLCAYLDLTGSGNETAAHLKHDGRVTIMLNSFTKKPLIMRLYGRGRVALSGTAEFNTHISAFTPIPGTRQIIFIEVESLQTSCGYAVPEMELVRERPLLAQWAEAKGKTGIQTYQRENNVVSIDGFDTGLSDTDLPK